MLVVFSAPPTPLLLLLLLLSPVGSIMVCQNTHMKGYFIVCVILLLRLHSRSECGEIFTIEDSVLVHRHAVNYSRSDTRCWLIFSGLWGKHILCVTVCWWKYIFGFTFLWWVTTDAESSFLLGIECQWSKIPSEELESDQSIALYALPTSWSPPPPPPNPVWLFVLVENVINNSALYSMLKQENSQYLAVWPDCGFACCAYSQKIAFQGCSGHPTPLSLESGVRRKTNFRLWFISASPR